MSAGNEKNAGRVSLDGEGNKKRKKNDADSSSGENAGQNRQREDAVKPVRISREDAEKNIPADPDPDDPVSP